MVKPKISVIIPTYNSAQYIERVFKSILEQHYDNFEVICLDDCSLDNTCAIIEQYTQNDKRFQLITHTVNQGPGILRNEGLLIATGDYILFCDSDDWYEQALFEKLADIIVENPNINVIEFRYNCSKNEQEKSPANWLDRGNSGVRQVVNEDIMLATALWNKCYKASFLIEKELYEKKDRISCGEIPYVICSFLLAREFYYLNYIGYNWRTNTESLSQNIKNRENHWLSFFDAINILKKEMLHYKIYNERIYEQFVIRMLSWKINTDIGTLYHKVYYKKTRNVFKTFRITKNDFRFKNDYKIFQKVKKQPYLTFLLIKKMKGKK